MWWTRGKPFAAAAVKVAYLVNQYPKVSHSFIRREIAGLEACGVEVARFSVRSCAEELVDPADLAERQQTRYILAAGGLGLLAGVVRSLVAAPLAWFRTLALAVRVGWGSERGVAIHAIYFAEACLLRGWLAAAAVEHLHSHFGTNATTVAMLCRALGGPPYSFTVHGPEEFDKVEAIALPEKIARAAFVVAISSFGRSQLWRWCPYDQWSKIAIVRCGLDRDFLHAEPVPVPERPRWVCVGRLSEQKGHFLLLDALAQLAREGRDFEIGLVGDGELRAQVEAQIARYDLQARVRILGWAPSAAVREQIAASQLLVLPSFAEGLPVVLMEALALTRPAVSTYVAGIPELIEPGKTGWLVPAGSQEALTAALREASDTPRDRLWQMGKAGRERVAAVHDAAREAAKLAALFRGKA